MLAINRAFLQNILRDKRVAKKVNNAKTWSEVTAIIKEEIKRQGHKIAEV